MRASILLLLLACAPKPVAPPAAPSAPAPVEYVPAAATPLAPRPFTLPAVAWGSIGASTKVAVVENHEVPFISVSIQFPVHSTSVPKGKAGLAEATMDMLNEGAGKRDAEAISAELRRLGATLGSGAGYDGASVSISCLKDTLGPTLDLLADVLLRPTFPAKEWDLRRSLWIDDLTESRTSPTRIADRVMAHRLWGNTYRGIEADEGSLKGITVNDMVAWHKAHLSLAGALVLVGGDTTLDEIVPALQSRLGKWDHPVAKPEEGPTAPARPDVTTVYLYDKPGAAQSVVRAAMYLGKPTDPDFAPFMLGNMAMGGQFASRINLNLREDKGYTYGARSGVSYDRAGVSWTFDSGIHTEKTADALKELFGELKQVRDGRPFTDKEVNDARGALLGGWPLRFERPDYLLGQLDAMRTYSLPDDWVTGYLDRLSRTSVADVQKAWEARVDAGRLTFVVVGDAGSIRSGIEQLGLRVVLVDVAGNEVGGK